MMTTMLRKVEIPTARGGFFHPFARSVWRQTPDSLQPAAPKADAIRPLGLHPDGASNNPFSGGSLHPQTQALRQ
jgi:hypothetical protein